MLLIKNAKEVLQLVNNDEAIINEVTQENQTLQKKITSDIIEVKKDSKEIHGKNFLNSEDQSQTKTKTTTLIFTNIKEENESTWKDCATAHFPSILF